MSIGSIVNWTEDHEALLTRIFFHHRDTKETETGFFVCHEITATKSMSLPGDHHSFRPEDFFARRSLPIGKKEKSL